jgi:hypothetical protein
MAAFDSGRATLRDKQIFPPFYVEETIPLSEALRRNKVRKETHLMVIERKTRRIALLTKQMIYHHVAQGEIDGEAWMVSL